jgi:hypothetical protein
MNNPLRFKAESAIVTVSERAVRIEFPSATGNDAIVEMSRQTADRLQADLDHKLPKRKR